MDRKKKKKKAGILGIIGNIFLLIIKASVRFYLQKPIYDCR